MDAQSATHSPACNQSVIVGELTQLPEFRGLPSGSSLVSFSLTVRLDGQKTTSVPLTWFDPPKRVDRWKQGDHIIAVGSVVRRFYHAGGAPGSRTDVTVKTAETLGRRGRSSQVLEGARVMLDGLVNELEPG